MVFSYIRRLSEAAAARAGHAAPHAADWKYRIVVRDLGKRYEAGSRILALEPDKEDGDEDEDEDEVGVQSASRRGAIPKRDWALRHISFKVAPGEGLLITGEIASGKTTLAKILSGIVAPSEGTAFINGRRYSLLHRTSLFRNDKSVLDNIRLQAQFTGYEPEYVDPRLRDILAISGLEEHGESRYGSLSQGMQSRLGLALALGLEPDLLIAGDRLLPSDDDYRETVIPILHKRLQEGMALVVAANSAKGAQRFCKRVLLLHEGHAVKEMTLDNYLQEKEQGDGGEARPARRTAALPVQADTEAAEPSERMTKAKRSVTEIKHVHKRKHLKRSKRN